MGKNIVYKYAIFFGTYVRYILNSCLFKARLERVYSIVKYTEFSMVFFAD
jgi:hypothetical protein